MKEVWMGVHLLPGYECYRGYEVSNMGRARSQHGILTPWHDEKGSLRITLYHRDVRCKPMLRRLVAELFVPDRDEEAFLTVNLNGDKEDCSVGNVGWVTLHELRKYYSKR